jgi:hypothetical protein
VNHEDTIRIRNRAAAPAAEIKAPSGNGAKAAVRELCTLCTLFERATLIHFLTAPAAAPTHRAKGFDTI